MNWYKKASQITPDPNLIQWMVKQAKPYIQALMINKTIRDIKGQLVESKSPKDIAALKDRLKIYQSMPRVKFPPLKENPRGEIIIHTPRNIIPKKLKALMQKHKNPSMLLILRYQMHAAAFYEEDYDYDDQSVIAITVNLMEVAKAKDPYQYATELIRHELVHNIQHLMSNKDYEYGLPSKSISTPEYNYEYSQKPKNDTEYAYHSLIDSEFYPRLSEKILKINYYKQKNPNLDMAWFKGFIEKDDWLNALRENSTGKYHKAINELLKEFQK